MAKAFLRKYIREIESQVDHSQFDEAIAHCRHILRKYPKHLDTYRMLGKAYLEARRYNEATDIFHRLLMAVPDDFVAHVGMSIINDVQQNMDASIWHMERAFEVQPSNSAIQAELQRLYSRRDGVEPPKIRLTRGALSHMYVQGELYPQAISEITGVLGDDPGRQDMQVLLALAYFHAGQKNESAEICAQLLRRYPYCLEANRILVELGAEGEASESTQVHRGRVVELDPYANFVTGSVFRSRDVPDEAVSIERLVWDGQPVEMDAEWESSLGIGMAGAGSAMDDQPAWLKSAVSDDMLASALDEGAGAGGEAEDIPEFLRDAGWGATSGTAEGGAPDSSAGGEPALVEGDLPDWVRAMAPEGMDTAAEESGQADAPVEDAGTPDWVDALGSTGSETGAAEARAPEAPPDVGLPGWLTDPQTQPPAGQAGDQPAPAGGADVPDWLAGEAHEPAAEQQPAQAPGGDEGVSDWLGTLDADEGAPASPGAAEEGGAPDWLGSLGADLPGTEAGEAGAADEGGAPDWLGSLGAGGTVSEEPGEGASPQEGMPEWLDPNKPEDQRETAPLESPSLERARPEWLASEEEGAPAGGGGDEAPAAAEPAPDWLADLGAGPAAPGGSGEAPEGEQSLDWLQALGAGAVEATGAGAQEENERSLLDESELAGWLDELEQGSGGAGEPAVFDKTDTGSLGTSESEQDEALSWLEGLAAKHGAKSEELLTSPDERAEAEPEWVQKARTLGTASEVPPAAPGEVESAPAAQPDEPAPPAASEEPASAGGPLPGEHDTVDLGISPEEQEQALSWLEGLAAGHGAKPEELLTKPEERRASEPDWVARAKALGAESPPAGPGDEQDATGLFLKGLAGGEPSGQEGDATPDSGAAEQIPDWLTDQLAAAEKEGGEYSPPGEPAAEEIPDWITGQLAAAGEQTAAGPEPVAQDGADSRAAEPPVEQEPAPAEQGAVESLPDWLAGLDEEQRQGDGAASPGAPEWLAESEEQQAPRPEPVRPSDWQPAGEAPGELSQPEGPPAPPPASPSAPPPGSRTPASGPEAPARPRRTGELSESGDPLLAAAQTELLRGNIPGAMEGYGKLIKKGNLLDETIFDLRGALQRYPVEVTIWQALGDAYMRANRLQEALDAYTKAEELLR